MNKKLIVILIAVCFVGLVLGLIWLGSHFNKVEEAKPPETHPLCVDFKPVKGEISCDEAIKIAKESVGGEIISIDKNYGRILYNIVYKGKDMNKEILYYAPAPDFPGFSSTETKYDVWILGIKTEKMIKKVILNLDTGEILINE